MAKKKEVDTVVDAADDISMEEAFSRLDEVINRMEEGSLPLEETFALYEEGLKLVVGLEGKIDRIEKKLQVLEENLAVAHDEEE